MAWLLALLKPRFCSVLNKLDPGKLMPDLTHRTVHRIIVHHENLRLKPLNGLLNRVQTLLQEIFDVVVDYDNGQDPC